MKRTPIKELRFGADDTSIISIDWSEAFERDPDGVTIWQAAQCSECNAVMVTNTIGENRHCELEDTSCMGWVTSDGPMMNCYYPFKHFYLDPKEAALAIADLPLCLIYFGGNNMLREEESYALALTGGGMNLSWEICEAFMRLGYLPPLFAAHLPRMSDRGRSRRDRWILAGCRRVFREHIQHSKYTLSHLRGFRSHL